MSSWARVTSKVELQNSTVFIQYRSPMTYASCFCRINSRICEPVPTFTTYPSSTYAAPSAYSNSSKRCVTQIAVTAPALESTACRTASITPRWSSSSKNVVSSSRSNNSGFSTNAPAMATRCFCPPLNVATCRSYASGSVKFTNVNASSTRVRMSLSDSDWFRPKPNATSAPTVGMMT
mmetsp:Transcript_8329/g.27668  ORF Transcript_8329/g.27668 Transcript_8329/m.27668 type:complete len:178 (-) Transcript_8329:409-942(-)